YPPANILSRAPTLPDMGMPRGRKTPATQDSYFPPVSPIPEYGGRESSAFSTGAPTRAYTPINGPPRSNTPNHQQPLARLQTPSNSNSGGYIAFNPRAQSTTPAPPPMSAGGSYRDIEMTREPVELPSTEPVQPSRLSKL
ncbi:hypothetical protein LTR66_017012, partial [Elasticomyces elasticus]